MLDPDTAPLHELDRELARLQRRYRTASHEVGEHGVRPDGIDDATLAWWSPPTAPVAAPVRAQRDGGDHRPGRALELRTARLRKPPR
jgi:hypothetical protein